MKKIHLLGVALVAMLAFGVVGAVSASAATLQWLAGGATFAGSLASTTEGEITLGSENGLGIGIKSSVLCSGKFIGTVGPGLQDVITEVQSLLNVKLGLPTTVTCVGVSLCSNTSTVAPVNLPWLTELRLSGALILDVILPDGAGNPGWEVKCATSLGTVEETCTSVAQTSELENDAAENDVLGKFIKEVTGSCSLGGANTGWVESSAADGSGLSFLTGGEALAVSEA